MGFEVDRFGNPVNPNDPALPGNRPPGVAGVLSVPGRTAINPIRSTPVNDVTAVGVTERFLPANIGASTKPSFVNSYANGVAPIQVSANNIPTSQSVESAKRGVFDTFLKRTPTVLSTGYLDTVARQEKVFQIDQQARNNGITVAEQLQRTPFILLALIPIGIFALAKFLRK